MLRLQLFLKTLDPFKQPSSIPLHEVKLKTLDHPSAAVRPASHPSLSVSEAFSSKASTDLISVIGLVFLFVS